MGVFGFLVAVAAMDAGRVGDNGTGAMLIAPELLETSTPPVITCNQPVTPDPRQIVFERLAPGTLEQPLRAASAEGRITFEWNAATGELSFATATPSGVFTDLESIALRTAALSSRSCGSR